MTYKQALAGLSAYQGRGWRLGLDRMREFASRAGLADYAAGSGVGFFHVAGTNGKGSVTAGIQNLLVSQGVRTGAFYSPYVIDPRERIQIDDRLISEDEFVRAYLAVKAAADSLEDDVLGGVTEFEYKTAMGLSAWSAARCEAVALEVGLGGRLDATNIVTPVVCAVVSIGLDHTVQLGGTLGEIAWEKAGILKPGVTAVVGEMPTEARVAIEAVAARVEAPLWRVGTEVRYRDLGDGVEVFLPGGRRLTLPIGIRGAKQAHNLAVAVACLAAGGRLDDSAPLANAARSIRLPGRNQVAQWRGREWRLDGAHNVDAAKSLAETLRSEGCGKVVLLAGMLEGHNPTPFFRELAGLAASVHLAPIDFHRSRNPTPLAAELAGLFAAHPHATLTEAIAAVAADRPHLPVLVTGSFYLVGEVARAMIADGVAL